ncbi:MAG: chemotaxis protein CheW [Vulcanimicrobiota bacterium]
MSQPNLQGEHLLDRPPPQGYLEAWSELLAKPARQLERRHSIVLMFGLGNEQLALPCRVLEGVVELRPVRRLPHRSGGLLQGVINLQGRLELCVCLEHLLGIEAGGPPERLLVLRQQQRRYAFGVTRIVGLHDLSQDELSAEGAGSTPMLSFILGTFEHEGRITALLDHESLLEGLAGGVTG